MLKEYDALRDLVIPFYNLNDVSHTIDHADWVACNVLEFGKSLGLEENIIKCGVVAAYCHDVQCYVNRKLHHVLAFAWVHRNKKEIMELTGVDSDAIELIATACYEHRGSYTGDFSSIVSELLSAADRGAPVQSLDLFKRSYLYNYHHGTSDHDKAVNHALTHINEKYGINGYAKYSPLYKKLFASDIETLQQWVTTITYDALSTASVNWHKL